MKKLMLVLGIMCSLFSYSQKATYEQVITKQVKGEITEYISKSGESFKEGDTIVLGFPFRNENYDYIKQVAMGMNYYPVQSVASGSSVVIKKIRTWGKLLVITTTKAVGYVYPLSISNFEGALESGEIVSNIITPEKALNILKTEKDKLDLGLITEAQYNLKKEEMSKYIK